ncbi:MAG TPA: lytic transglycosylase domain-containing protein [Gemmatimonadaceae bacterium]|nr:lytic transglycosylase domain-containing protein [Gemmatimonadaceae bacterium]
MASAAIALGLAASIGPLQFLGGPGRTPAAATATSNQTSSAPTAVRQPAVSVASVAPSAAAAEPAPPAPAPPQPTWQLANIDNGLVSKWIGRFTTSMRSDFATYLSRMSTYGSTVAKEIESRSMPLELVYLPLIESGYKPTAKSPVKATGLWQFMTATAKQYGLTVTSKVDERKDPAKSTDAALSYLDDLYHEFGSWYLAAAAYNAGAGRVRSALVKVTGKTTGTDADFYRIASALPAETRDYVPKLIAAARIAKDPTKYGFTVDSATLAATTEAPAGELLASTAAAANQSVGGNNETN